MNKRFILGIDKEDETYDVEQEAKDLVDSGQDNEEQCI